MLDHVFIIAEAGVNHNGSMDLACKLVDAAADAGCDAVKFQTFKTENVISVYAPKADYQKTVTGSEETQFAMVKKLELTYAQFTELAAYCRTRGIMFLSTPFDLESIDFLAGMHVPIIKIPSGEITNLPYLRKAGSLKRKIILSTGMSDLAEIRQAVDILMKHGSTDIALLHCHTDYPTQFSDVNLQAINLLKEEFKCEVGYSDHTLGIEVPVAAVAIGATIIEKHFTLDKNMPGPDHKASLGPEELKSMVIGIRHIEMALGAAVKQPSVSEQKNLLIARKSIVAACPIKAGEVFTEKNITCKRPGNGISPMKWGEVLGSKAQKSYVKDELI